MHEPVPRGAVPVRLRSRGAAPIVELDSLCAKQPLAVLHKRRALKILQQPLGGARVRDCADVRRVESDVTVRGALAAPVGPIRNAPPPTEGVEDAVVGGGLAAILAALTPQQLP